MNKLQEIIEQSYVRIFNGDYDKNYEDTVKETIKEACVEYARSIIPTPEEVVKEFFIGDKTLTQVYIDRIDQDLQSLN